MESYKIICLKCKAERPIKVFQTALGKRIDWLETPANSHHPIMSGRERLDGHFGFQCACGNNDLLTSQEKRTFSNPAAPKPQEINEIVKKLQPERPKFEMVGA